MVSICKKLLLVHTYLTFNRTPLYLCNQSIPLSFAPSSQTFSCETKTTD